MIGDDPITGSRLNPEGVRRITLIGEGRVPYRGAWGSGTGIESSRHSKMVIRLKARRRLLGVRDAAVRPRERERERESLPPEEEAGAKAVEAVEARERDS